jgi:hypothetical protein
MKWVYYTIVLIILAFIFALIPLHVFGYTDFTENYDSYAPDTDYFTASSTSGWLVSTSSWAWITDEYYDTYSMSLWRSTSTAITSGRSIEKTIDTPITSGKFGGRFKFTNYFSEASFIQVAGFDASNNDCFSFLLGSPSDNLTKIYISAPYPTGSATTSFYTIPTGWLTVIVEWNATDDILRYYLDGSWTEWFTGYTSCDGVKRISITDQNSWTAYDVYIDSLGTITGVLGCSTPDTIHNVTDCDYCGYCWSWWPQGLLPIPEGGGNCYYCEDTNTCGNADIDAGISCPACDNSTDCIANSKCEWVSEIGYCRSKGNYDCGTQGACKWCYASSTCEAQGCEWDYNLNFCSYNFVATTTAPDYAPWFSNSVKYWFIPHADFLKQRFQIVANTVSHKFPFGYFYYVVDLVEAELLVASNTATSSNLLVYNMEIASHTLPIVDLQNVKNHMPGVFSLINLLLKVSIWSGFLLYIYLRVRDTDVGV